LENNKLTRRIFDEINGHLAGKGGVDQTGGHVHTHVRLHAEVPVIAYFGLAHRGIPLAVLVLRRWWGRDQRGVDDGPLAQI
jgi:hypothetical protein